MTAGQVSQIGVSVWGSVPANTPLGRVSQTGIQVWSPVPANNPKGRVSQVGIQAWLQVPQPVQLPPWNHVFDQAPFAAKRMNDYSWVCPAPVLIPIAVTSTFLWID